MLSTDKNFSELDKNKQVIGTRQQGKDIFRTPPKVQGFV